MYRRIMKTCTWKALDGEWFMRYAVVTGGDNLYIYGL